MLLGARRAIAEATTMANRRLLIPDGEYLVVASIESDGKKLGEVGQRVFAIAEFSERLKAAQAQLAGIAASSDARVKAVAEQAVTPAFWIQRLLPLTQSAGEESPNPVEELRRIEATVAALARGENPFATERGEVERAYRASDGQLVPYRIYVPKSYDGQTSRPLVVLLHGALGDEKTYFSDLYDVAVIKGEAEKRGWVFVAPNGRGRFGGYGRDPAIEDVTRVVGLVKRDYKIDEAKVYLSGHSLGGGGTWIIAANQPDLFAAISPVSGGGAKGGEEVKRILTAVQHLPVLIVHGAKDGIVPPQGSRDMYEAARKAGMKATYLELPNDDHVTIVGASFVEVLNFFEKHGKPSARQ
jgi:predicted peptidase